MTSEANLLPELQQNENIDSFDSRLQRLIENKSRTESPLQQGKRTTSQLAARAGETIAGFPGNLKKAVLQSRDIFLDALFPGGSEEFKKTEEQAFGRPKEGSFSDYLINPPTSTELRETVTPEISEMLTGEKEYLEPKNEKERFAGELTQDITSFFMPGTNRLRTITRIGAPILGNLAKEGLKFLGAEESQAEKAKLGFMLMTTLTGQSNPGKFASERISQARQMVPQNTTINVRPLANRLIPLYNRLQRGLGVPSKSKTMQGMKDLAKQSQNGRMNMQSLMDARDDINEWISEAGGFDVPATIRDKTLANLNNLKRQIINTLDENLSTRFPEAGELYRTGYEAAAVTHRSNAISNFIEKYFGKKVASAGAKLLFPSLAGSAAFLPKTAGIAASTYPIYKSGQVLYRVANSPTLARYYQDVIRDSMIGNAPAMIKSMEKLDKALAEDEKKQSKGKKLSLEEFKSEFMNMD